MFIKVNLGGGAGLGNQMFQLAAAYSLAKRINAPLKAVISKEKAEASKDISNRQYSLNNQDFSLEDIEFVSEEELNKAPCFLVCERNFFREHKGRGRIIVTGGFFESEIFFKDFANDVKKIFTLKKTKTPFIEKHLPEIDASNSVAVHVRRGDYKGFSWRLMPVTYYAQAMQKFSDQPDVKFFVFTDDPIFAKENFANLKNVMVVSDGTATFLEELYLMTQCKSLIIANSTFSWWAAYLCKNSNAKIIAPLPKYKDDYFTEVYPAGKDREEAIWIHTKEAHPKKWQTINPFTLETKKNSIDIFSWFKKLW